MNDWQPVDTCWGLMRFPLLSKIDGGQETRTSVTNRHAIVCTYEQVVNSVTEKASFLNLHYSLCWRGIPSIVFNWAAVQTTKTPSLPHYSPTSRNLRKSTQHFLFPKSTISVRSTDPPLANPSWSHGFFWQIELQFRFTPSKTNSGTTVALLHCSFRWSSGSAGATIRYGVWNPTPFGYFVKTLSMIKEFGVKIIWPRVSKCPISFWVGVSQIET